MEEGRRAKLTEVNPHLVCVLCHGYFVDATTITECLHSFCRSCISRHLERRPICPICEVAVHTSKLHRSLRPDKTLQDIVYKIVPGLYRNEMQRRREFYKQHPFRDEYLEPECRGVGRDRVIFSSNDHISLSLEFYDEDREREEWNNNNVIQKPVPIKKPSPDSKRYLQCPAGFSIRLLKKYIKLKCGLSDACEVDIIHRKESLPDSYSLMDVAYIYPWKKTEPMRFYYKLPDVSLQSIDAAKALASSKIVEDHLDNNANSTLKIMSDSPAENVPSLPVSHEVGPKAELVPDSTPKSAERKTESDPALSDGEKVKIVEPSVAGDKPVQIGEPVAKSINQSKKDSIEKEHPKKDITQDNEAKVQAKSNSASKPEKEPVGPKFPSKNAINGKPMAQTNGSRTMTEQDELPVSVLLSLSNSTPSPSLKVVPKAETKKTEPKVQISENKRSEPKFILPKPVPNANSSPTIDHVLNKKTFSGSKVSVNKIASDLAECKNQNRIPYKPPGPFSSNPLMLSPPPTPIQFSKLADPTMGQRTPFHTALSPQHLPVYPPPMMPSITKAVPWKDNGKAANRYSVYTPRSKFLSPAAPPYLKNTSPVSPKETKKPADPFAFQANEGDSSFKSSTADPLGQNGDHKQPNEAKVSQTIQNDNKTKTNKDSPNIVSNLNSTDTKTYQSELSSEPNGGVTNGTHSLKMKICFTNGTPNEIKSSPVQSHILQKNLSKKLLNCNGIAKLDRKRKIKSVGNEQNIGFENKTGDAKADNGAADCPPKKKPSLSRKGHTVIPGGVMSKTGPWLDQRLQQLYRKNNRQQFVGTTPEKPAVQSPGTPPPSRLASWLNNRFNSTPPKTESPPHGTADVEGESKKDSESAAAKLGKEMSMLKKKLDELRKNAEGCEITQENPSAAATNKVRDVTPLVSIERMKASDMSKIDATNSAKSKEKSAKRPVPGLKAIQDVVEVKKIKVSSDEDDVKKSDKKSDDALDLSGAGKPSDELANRIALLQKNGALSNPQQLTRLLNRPLVTNQLCPPPST
ncbi:Zinc finger, C3HHypothetical protein type (RING finger) [Nesidiocoris tenuis]|uniref:RING-type domain-containing protein n=1 Tax=Nesidiocoris tenuis TaxID=355587 RepID=A0ABN7A600_9HEMI|nr:Zinc finger, C3HHypothetical protein type (RING finger) [Nesidiocoris tenuis]